MGKRAGMTLGDAQLVPPASGVEQLREFGTGDVCVLDCSGDRPLRFSEVEECVHVAKVLGPVFEGIEEVTPCGLWRSIVEGVTLGESIADSHERGA